ncbi:MAG: fumarate hydratase [Desulfurococcales archaeon]|nr:fumarate hydratase [Desulfurococcales archaeon]
MSLSREKLEEIFYNFILTVATGIPEDVYNAIRKAYETEENPVAKTQLKAILEDMEVACKETRPICQDTGTPYLWIEIGEEFPIKPLDVEEAFIAALRRATKEGYLRPNAVDPLYAKNSGDNTGRFIPWIHFEPKRGNELKVNLMFKGGGSEAPSTLIMSTPLKGFENLYKGVIDAIVRAGPLPCPPVIVGVAIGAGADIVMSLAKKALLRPIGERHPDPKAAKIEEELLEAINKLGIGPHGFGGKYTALDVKFEYAHRHPATFAIGIITSCWATRRGSIKISPDGSFQVLTRHLRREGDKCVIK